MLAYSRIILLLLIGICFSMETKAFESKRFGTFTGIVSHDSLEKNQLVKLELVPVREDGGNIGLRGILTLQFGGYDTGEYISYHFHDVLFNLLTGVMTFNQTDQDVYIKDAKISDNMFSGELYSTSGRVGPITLSKKNNILPNKPLIEPLNGEYRGKCENDPGNLQLFTYRSINDNSRLGNPFGAYEVKGQLGKSDATLCVGEKKKYCTYSKLKSASYDFFNGNLVLNGDPFNYACTVSGKKINCGDCQFQRVSDEMKKPLIQYKAVNEDPFAELNLKINDNNSLGSLSGQYTGYLYHDNLNKYQKVQIEVTTYQQPTANGSNLILSAIARLQFGESKTEVLNYKFDPIEFPNPLVKPQFVLSRPEADVDALLQVTDMGGGVIKGNWHSIIFGKVGSFVVTKNGDLPEIKSTSTFVDQISSTYEEHGNRELQRDLILDLIVSKDRAPLNSDNPFFPLNIKGWIWRKSGIIAKEDITQSSYDFYTGRVALLYGDEQVVTGQINSNEQIKFRRLGGGFGTFMQNFDLVTFKKQNRK